MEVLARFRRGLGEVSAKFRRGFGEALARLWRGLSSFGKAAAKLGQGFGEVPTRNRRTPIFLKHVINGLIKRPIDQKPKFVFAHLRHLKLWK
jgi:hypothetical protein